MQFILLTIFISGLGIIVFQDFKSREITWWTLPLILISYLLSENYIFQQLFINAGLNFLFILINFLCLTVYYSLKDSAIVNIVNSKLGIGDILFLIVCCFMFNLIGFIGFIIFSLLLSLLIGIVIQNKHNKTIPLAGIMSGLIILLTLTNQFITTNIFRDEEWIKSIL